MARKTAPKRGASPKRSPKPQQNQLRWPSFILGVVMGVVGSSLVFLAIKQSETPEPVADEVAQEEPATQEEGDSPYFDFYAVLPDMEVVVPTEDMPSTKKPSQPATAPKPSKIENAKPVQEKPRTPEEAAKPKPQAGEYMLQAGSFSRSDDAERRRAELGLQGFNASIQPVELDSGATTHRVMVGPYTEMDAMQQAKKKLANAGIDTLAIRVRK